ncbi:MAG: hypothetical protein ACE5PV_23955 [Candidatus Poribacteria bacterium]
MFENDKKMRAAIASQIDELVVEYLKNAAGVYKEAHGKYPGKLEDLIRAGLINTIPTGPDGTGYIIESETGEIKRVVSR